ncbi:MAG: hypothetical protein AABY64_12450 [Bdellovibrionota bacterium]
MSKETENYLSLALRKLEMAYEKIVQSKGYSEESEKIKILAEFAKEQVENENTHSAAR